MSRPKVGDRVRWTVEGTVREEGNVVCDAHGYSLSNLAKMQTHGTVEVLPSAAMTFMGVEITDDMILAVAKRLRELKAAGRLR